MDWKLMDPFCRKAWAKILSTLITGRSTRAGFDGTGGRAIRFSSGENARLYSSFPEQKASMITVIEGQKQIDNKLI